MRLRWDIVREIERIVEEKMRQFSLTQRLQPLAVLAQPSDLEGEVDLSSEANLPDGVVTAGDQTADFPSTRPHSSLSGAELHDPKPHTHPESEIAFTGTGHDHSGGASGARISHGNLVDVGPDDHHPRLHASSHLPDGDDPLPWGSGGGLDCDTVDGYHVHEDPNREYIGFGKALSGSGVERLEVSDSISFPRPLSRKEPYDLPVTFFVSCAFSGTYYPSGSSKVYVPATHVALRTVEPELFTDEGPLEGDPNVEYQPVEGADPYDWTCAIGSVDQYLTYAPTGTQGLSLTLWVYPVSGDGTTFVVLRSEELRIMRPTARFYKMET